MQYKHSQIILNRKSLHFYWIRLKFIWVKHCPNHKDRKRDKKKQGPRKVLKTGRAVCRYFCWKLGGQMPILPTQFRGPCFVNSIKILGFPSILIKAYFYYYQKLKASYKIRGGGAGWAFTHPVFREQNRKPLNVPTSKALKWKFVELCLF